MSKSGIPDYSGHQSYPSYPSHPSDLVEARPEGLYCVPGDFYIDAWQPVQRCVVTHAHSDHATPGHGHYLAVRENLPLLHRRIGDAVVDTLAYGESVVHNGVTLSFHPAGHVLGSAQVRLEYRGEVWVVSGDYKLDSDPTCAAYEPVRCDTFITESTFGLPIYRWPDTTELMKDINAWWSSNASEGRASIIFCYALGKAQRILAGIDPGIGPIVCHGAVTRLNEAYREAGVVLPDTITVDQASRDELGKSLVLAPPSAMKSPWLKRFGDYSDAFASGWMLLRGARRRRAVDRGFIMSDHADWPGLLLAIGATGASRVIVTHGYSAPLVRWLQEQGLEAGTLTTRYGDEEDGSEEPVPHLEGDKSKDKGGETHA
jgi:putative mRNA 3-end processing factor